MTLDPSIQPGAFGSRRMLSAEEVMELRQRMWADGTISTDDAGALFELNDEAAPSDAWTDFFVEAICDYMISRGQPRGYVSEEDSKWLIDKVSSDGRVESHAELELLVKLFERATAVPASLKQFALQQVEQTVLNGSGPTRRGPGLEPGRISNAEVQVLRRLLFAPGGDGPARVSRSEADMLFRLKEAATGENCDDWPRFFAQAIANHLMASKAYVPVEREVAARFEEPTRPNPFRNILSQMGRNPGSIIDPFVSASEHERAEACEESVERDAAVNAEEAAWLKGKMKVKRPKGVAERALVQFLKDEGVSID